MLKHQRPRGQSLIEYAVLVSAVALGVVAAASICYKHYVGHAQRTERWFTVF